MFDGGQAHAVGSNPAPPAELGRASALDGFTPQRRRTDIRDGQGVAEATPSGTAARRDSVFRRLLALADVLAATVAILVGGALLAADLVNLGSIVGLPLIVLAAKTLGLYDRDELVIHKMTLSDAPKLFYVTTLFTLVYTVVQADLQNTTIATETIVVLWLLLMGGIMVARLGARRLARALTPPERCVLVGDVSHATRVRRMLESRPTLSAELVAAIPFDSATARGEDADAFGAYLRRSDFHRVIVTHTDNVNGANMIDTIRVFKSRGIKVSVLPSLFDVLGSAVEFDDLGGATLLGVRRYGLTRSSQLMKRGLDIVVAGDGPHRARAPLRDDRPADQAQLARPRLLPPDTRRPRRHPVQHRQVPDDAQRCRRAQDRTARPQRDARPLQDRGRPPRHQNRPPPAPLVARRAAAALERPPRRDEPGGPAPARRGRGRAGRRLAPSAGST